MHLGLVAGNGRFPFLVLEAARAAGVDVRLQMLPGVGHVLHGLGGGRVLLAAVFEHEVEAVPLDGFEVAVAGDVGQQEQWRHQQWLPLHGRQSDWRP